MNKRQLFAFAGLALRNTWSAPQLCGFEGGVEKDENSRTVLMPRYFMLGPYILGFLKDSRKMPTQQRASAQPDASSVRMMSTSLAVLDANKSAGHSGRLLSA